MTKEQIRTKFDRWAERVGHTPFENDLDNATLLLSYDDKQTSTTTSKQVQRFRPWRSMPSPYIPTMCMCSCFLCVPLGGLMSGAIPAKCLMRGIGLLWRFNLLYSLHLVIQKKLLELGAMRIDVRNGTEIWQPTYRGKLVGRTDLSILDQYNGEVRGFCNYYAIANNRSKLHKFRYIMEYSFYKTLACKYRTTKGKIIAQYRIVKDIGVKFQDKHGNERIRLLWKDSLARDPYPL